MFNRIKKRIKNAIVAFSYGLKNTETDIFGQKSINLGNSIIEQQVQQNALAEALLKGEVTEQVEMLRDRTYLVSDKSKEYKVIINTVGTTKAIKKMGKRSAPIVFNEDGFDISIVMDNNAIPSGVLDGLDSVGGYGIKNYYPLKFNYDYSPKYNLDEYINKFVLRHSENKTMIDFYVPKHTDSFERLEKIFDNELNKIKEGKIKPNNIEFSTVYFITEKAFGEEDLIPYKFKMKRFVGINDFDGKNILTYEVDAIERNEKLTEKYKNKKVRDAYENVESRGAKIDLGNSKKEEHKCERCGEEVVNEYDFRITKKTIGVGLCQKCLEKMDKENN